MLAFASQAMLSAPKCSPVLICMRLAGSKLIVVLGHTKCGAVTASVKFTGDELDPVMATGCSHLDFIVDRIACSIDKGLCHDLPAAAHRA